jgi:hypothetical protein
MVTSLVLDGFTMPADDALAIPDAWAIPAKRPTPTGARLAGSSHD